MCPADQIGVLALPADPRRLPQRLFHHRRGIDEHLELAIGPPPHQPAGQRLQRLLHHIMVIATLRIDRNARPFGIIGQRQRIGMGGITHPQHDHASRLGPQALRPLPLVGAGGHPFHPAMVPFPQPLVQTGRAQRIVCGRGDAKRHEAQRPRLGPQGILKRKGSGRVNHPRGCSDSSPACIAPAWTWRQAS